MTHPLSMTCFGRGEATDGQRTWVVELKSVNHRYCDVNIRMQRSYAALEERIRKEVAAVFNRGHVEISISQRGVSSAAIQLELNLPLATQYHDILSRLTENFGYADKPSLALLAAMKDVVTEVEVDENLDLVWQHLRQALQDALAAGLSMRRREGAALKEDLLQRLGLFREIVLKIEKALPDAALKKTAQLRERLAVLLQDAQIDETRLAQEIAFLADKADVSEELVRLQSHMKQFEHFLQLAEPVGRRLDFLMQEFLREINTMASKIADSSITHLTVEMKNEVEKMREQVQNLE